VASCSLSTFLQACGEILLHPAEPVLLLRRQLLLQVGDVGLSFVSMAAVGTGVSPLDIPTAV
jgi:hypothetical protein